MGAAKGKRQRGGAVSLTMTGVMAAVLCAVSPWALMVGPIPFSLCTLAIYLAVYVLDWKKAAMSTAVYVLLGAVGVPVFSGFGAGLGKVMGPTGGYIVGYVLLALLAGLFIQWYPNGRGWQLVGMVLGTAALYAVGTAWYCFQCGQGLGPALALCVLPFLPGDAVKMAAALAVGPGLRRQLIRAGLITI